PAWSSLRATASAPAVNLQSVLNRLTGLTIIAFIQKIGSRGSDPRLLGLTMGWHLDHTCGERPRVSRSNQIPRVRPTLHYADIILWKMNLVLRRGRRGTPRRDREETPETRTRVVPRGITCPVPSRSLRECRLSGLRPLLGLNLRGKILPRSHPPRIQRRSSLVLQECVLLRRCTLPSTSPETQPHLPSGALLFT